MKLGLEKKQLGKRKRSVIVKVKTLNRGWLLWILLFGILYWFGRGHYHLKHTGTFMIVLIILVAALVVAFDVLEGKKIRAKKRKCSFQLMSSFAVEWMQGK